MRIQIRKKDGSVVELDEDAAFVEVCTDAGELAGLFYMDNLGRAHSCTDPETPQAKQYVKVFGASFAKDIKRVED